MNGSVKHPNAMVALAASSGGGALVSWFLDDRLHLGLSSPACAAIAGGLGAFALFVGRNGVRGLVRVIWRGTTGSIR